MKGEYIFLSTRKILVTSPSRGAFSHPYYRKKTQYRSQQCVGSVYGLVYCHGYG